MSTKNPDFHEHAARENFIVSEELQSRLPEDFLLEKDSTITVDKEQFSVRIISASRASEEGHVQVDLEIERFSFLSFLENKNGKFSLGTRQNDCTLSSYVPGGSPSGGDLLIIFVGDA